MNANRIHEEFQLIQEIFAGCPGFDHTFNLYPNLQLQIGQDGWTTATELRNGQPVAQKFDTTRSIARWILRRWW